jgi:hypothetical protein
VVLTGASNYTGGTFICTCATLQLGDPTHTASIIGRVDNEGLLTVYNANTSGITTILNDGQISFLNATSASSAHIINNAVIDFSNTATAGSATITNNGGGIFFLTPAVPAARTSPTAPGALSFSALPYPGARIPVQREMRPSTITMLESFSRRSPMRAPPLSRTAMAAGLSFSIRRRPPLQSSSTTTTALRPSVSLSARIRQQPVTRRLQTIPAAKRISTRSRRPVMRSSPPTAAGRSTSSTTRPAATRSSSPTAPVLSISPPASVRTAMAALRRARSLAPAPTTSAPASR